MTTLAAKDGTEKPYSAAVTLSADQANHLLRIHATREVGVNMNGGTWNPVQTDRPPAPDPPPAPPMPREATVIVKIADVPEFCRLLEATGKLIPLVSDGEHPDDMVVPKREWTAFVKAAEKIADKVDDEG